MSLIPVASYLLLAYYWNSQMNTSFQEGFSSWRQQTSQRRSTWALSQPTLTPPPPRPFSGSWSRWHHCPWTDTPLWHGLLSRVATGSPQRGTFRIISKFTSSDHHVPSRFSISHENSTVWNSMKFVLFTQNTIKMEVSTDIFEAPHPSHPRHYV